MKTIKIACVGAGYWGKNLVRNLDALGVLGWICDTDPQRRQELGTMYPHVRLTDSLDLALADREVKGVVIATPAETHAHLVHEALSTGRDVFVEKPLSLSVAEGERLVEMAREHQRVLMVGHLLWYHPAVLKLKELVATGELGRIRYIYSNRLNLGKVRREENILWSFAPHDISVVLGLLNEMPSEIEAQGGNYLHDGIADVTVSLLSFPSGVKAHVFVSWLHPFKEQKLIVVGDRRMAVFDDVERDHKLILFPHGITWKDQIPIVTKAEAQPVPFEPGEPLRQECLHFLDCLARRTPPRTDGEEGLRVLKVLQQCQAAMEKTRLAHRPVELGAAQAYTAHETALVDEPSSIGPGTTIWHFSHVLKNSTIGRDCRIGQNVMIGPNVSIGNSVKIQNNVSVYEGVTLEDNVFCGPSMVFTNVINPRSEVPRMSELKRTLVRHGATLGANCTILCGVTIGCYAFVGAGAVVTEDVPDFGLVVGVPARLTGWMCACGNRITFKSRGSFGRCEACAKRYRRSETNVQLLPSRNDMQICRRQRLHRVGVGVIPINHKGTKARVET